MARIGPIVFEVAGDSYVDAARINAIIWEASTTAGDRAVLRHRLTHELLWSGRATGSHTYAGGNLGDTGIHAPEGFYVDRLDGTGVLMVYLREA